MCRRYKAFKLLLQRFILSVPTNYTPMYI